jgi:hypothetical protein
MGSSGHVGVETSSLRSEHLSTRPQGPDASRYVRAGAGDLIDVCEVSPDDRYARGPYTCLACGHLMVPALGRTRKHHFKHKAGRPADCNNETYLHQLAKMTLFSVLSEAIRTGQSYWLTRDRAVVCSYYQVPFGLPCTARRAPFGTDLSTIFDQVAVEAGVDGFVADILLSSSRSDARMLLEIVVTHPCDETKIESGLPIIEVSIRDEDAANRLRDGIDAASRHTRCHNLPIPDRAPHLCTTPCLATGLALLLYENGKAWYSELGIGTKEEVQILSDPHLMTHMIEDVKLGHQARPWKTVLEHLGAFMIQQAFEEGRSIRSCLICRNNGGRANSHDIYCAAQNRIVWMSSSAIGCRFYDPARDGDEAKLILGRLGSS